MKLRHLTLSAIIAMSLSSVSATAETYPEHGQLYADYLVGSYANFIDDAKARSDYFISAYKRMPDDIKLGRLALVSSLNTGDYDQTYDIAKKLHSKDKSESMARAVLALEAFSKGRTNRAQKYMKAPTSDLTVSILMSLMRGWNEVDMGKLEAARATFSSIGGATYFDIFGKLQIAKLELQEGNFEAAETSLQAVEEAGLSPVETLMTRARLEVARGDKQAAIDALEAFTEDNIASETGPIGEALNRLMAGGTIKTKYSARENAARAMVDPAFAFFVANRSTDGAEIYLRFARATDPDYHKGIIWLGALLEDTERTDEAYELYQEIGKSSPYYVSAQLNLANIHFAKDEDDQAQSVLEKLAESHPSFVTREALGRARFFREDYAGALPFYDELVNSMSEEELLKNVEPLRLRGIIYERIKQWDKAEVDFKKVLRLHPDNTDTLNYLGYTWVDRGENLNEAFDMIEKAVEMEPQSGAIVDSLGWAHYKLGQYEKAKINLEKAASLSPSSATIIDHLGDVYWKLGRKREAGYQWERALEFDPTDEERAAIEIKLKGGLEALAASQ